MKKLTAIVAAMTMILALGQVNLVAASAVLTGGVRGTVIDNSGRPPGSGIQARLVDSQGVTGMTADVSGNGTYEFRNVPPGTYTVQTLGTEGMSAVTVTAGNVSTANLTMQTGPGRASNTARWLIAAAVVGGAVTVVGVISTKDDASSSR